MQTLSKIVVWFLTLVLAQCLFPNTSQAHEGRPVYIEITELEQGFFHVQWRMPPVMASGDEPQIILSGKQCQFISGRQGAALSGQQHVQCTSLDPQDVSVELRYPNNNPALSSLIQVTRLSGDSFSLFNGPEISSIKLPQKLSFYQMSKQYTQGGLFHILEGYDHLLFVLCLIHIAGGLRRVLITVTGFTLAHSITLALASLDIIALRAELVEILIALSIVMLAVEMAKAATGGLKNSLIWRYPAAVASLLGLLHGLGFAGALAELGLPHTMKLGALAFFNLGVELGQVFFIAAVTSILYLQRRIWLFVSPLNSHRGAPREEILTLPLALIYGLGGLSCYWLIQRSMIFLA